MNSEHVVNKHDRPILTLRKGQELDLSALKGAIVRYYPEDETPEEIGAIRDALLEKGIVVFRTMPRPPEIKLPSLEPIKAGRGSRETVLEVLGTVRKLDGLEALVERVMTKVGL